VLELTELLARHRDDVPLDLAALQLASIEFPDLEPEQFLALLDSHAAELGGRVNRSAAGPEFIRQANQYLFDELGFRGNEDDYYHPRNSCLNEVLTSRTGLPITLSVVYMEIARRLGRPVVGIGLPGHFLVQYNDGLCEMYIDPFHRGQLLEASECHQLAKSMAGVDTGGDPKALAPAGNWQILVRMLGNLRSAYLRAREYAKTVEVLNLLLVAAPNAAEEHRQRGVCHVQLDRHGAAIRDLERYLELAPEAEDRVEVERQIVALRHWQAARN